MTLETIQLYRSHYQKIRKIAKKLNQYEVYRLQFEYQEGQLNSSFNILNEQNVSRLVSVLRPFLNPRDKLYYRSIWEELKASFNRDIPSHLSIEIERLIHQLNHSYTKLIIDDEEYTSEQIYELIAEGKYFGSDSNAKARLDQLVSYPVAGPILDYRFYEYSMNSIPLASAIFEAIKCVEQSDKYKELIKTECTPEKCIYCLQTDGGFQSAEHVIPEAIGNQEIILPKGYVCDRCNNGTLSQLDNYLVNFEGISFLSVHFSPYNKQGKLPVANSQNMKIEKIRPRELIITAKDPTANIKKTKYYANGSFGFSMKARGKPINAQMMGRALFKIALGSIAFQDGLKIYDEKYNKARDFILKQNDFANNFLMMRKVTPSPYIHIHYRDLPIDTLVHIDIYGLNFIINLGEDFKLDINDELEGFQAFSLEDNR